MTIDFYIQDIKDSDKKARYYLKENYYQNKNEFFRINDAEIESYPLIESPEELNKVEVDIDTQYGADEYYGIMTSIKPSVFEDTGSFQVKYGLLDTINVGFLEDSKMMVKINHLKEELTEIEKAYNEKNFPEFCDGLIDLIYVASGTLNLTNAPAEVLWNDVHLRNMHKIRATKDNVGKRGSTFDVIKPEGWQGPRTSDLIEAHKRAVKIVFTSK